MKHIFSLSAHVFLVAWPRLFKEEKELYRLEVEPSQRWKICDSIRSWKGKRSSGQEKPVLLIRKLTYICLFDKHTSPETRFVVINCATKFWVSHFVFENPLGTGINYTDFDVVCVKFSFAIRQMFATFLVQNKNTCVLVNRVRKMAQKVAQTFPFIQDIRYGGANIYCGSKIRATDSSFWRQSDP